MYRCIPHIVVVVVVVVKPFTELHTFVQPDPPPFPRSKPQNLDSSISYVTSCKTAPRGPRTVTRRTAFCTTRGCFMSGIFIDSIHAMKPLIYKFPLTFFFYGALRLPLFLPPLSCECVLRYTALFIKGERSRTSYSLERAFLFPDLKSALLFLGC